MNDPITKYEGDIMYLILIGKTLFLYLFIIFVYRLMGKKEVGELGIGDLIVTVLVAELAALSIEDTNKSILISIVPILVLVFSEITISYLSLKSEKFRNFVDGHPTVIIKNGKVNFSAMTKIRYTLDDLIAQLRMEGIKNIEEVDYAVLETSGDLSVFQNTKDYPMPLILDGVIQEKILPELKKDKNWILKTLQKQNVLLENVFYAFYTQNKLFIIQKKDLL